MARFTFWLLVMSVGVVALFPCTSGTWVKEPDGVVISNCPEDLTVSTNAGEDEARVTWMTPSITTLLNFPPFDTESVSIYDHANSLQTNGVDNGRSYPIGLYTITYAWCQQRCVVHAICQFNFEVEAGKEIPSPCESFPCMHGGTCSVTGQEYDCHCTEEYTGDRCQTLRPTSTGFTDPRFPCASNPCPEDRVCMEITEVFEPFYLCCNDGPTGLINCQLPSIAAPCHSDPCGNHGQCITLSTDTENEFTYRCDCNQGFEGTQCDIASEPCLSSPCIHGGTCVPNGPVFSCQCPRPYGGILCQSVIGEPNLTCPSKQSATFSANEILPGAPQGTIVMYPPAQVTDGFGTYDFTYSHPSGSFFYFGITTVRVRVSTRSGIFVASCAFDVSVAVEDGSIPLSPAQTQEVQSNYDILMDKVQLVDGSLDPAAFREPEVYKLEVVGELTRSQQEILLEQHPNLFVDKNEAQNTLIEENRRRRRNTEFTRICPLQFEAKTSLVIIADTDNSGHGGFESQLVTVNNQVQWAFNAECGYDICINVRQLDGSPCECCKTSRTVAALVFNIKASRAMGFEYMPVQFKQVYIYNCDGGV